MAFWEYETTVKACEELAEEEKAAQEGQSKGYNMNDYQRQQRNMMRNYSMPKIPSFNSGNFSMPKMPSL